MAWPLVIAWIVVMAVSVGISLSMAPKPTDATAAGLGDFTVPTAEVGREIPVLFGTRDLSGPNVVWYGDLSTKKVYD